MLIPPPSDVPAAAHRTTLKAAQRIFDLGLAGIKKPESVEALITSLEYEPIYPGQAKPQPEPVQSVAS